MERRDRGGICNTSSVNHQDPSAAQHPAAPRVMGSRFTFTNLGLYGLNLSDLIKKLMTLLFDESPVSKHELPLHIWIALSVANMLNKQITNWTENHFRNYLHMNRFICLLCRVLGQYLNYKLISNGPTIPE